MGAGIEGIRYIYRLMLPHSAPCTAVIVRNIAVVATRRTAGKSLNGCGIAFGRARGLRCQRSLVEIIQEERYECCSQKSPEEALNACTGVIGHRSFPSCVVSIKKLETRFQCGVKCPQAAWRRLREGVWTRGACVLLSQYVIAVLIVWAVILAGVWVFDRERFATFAHVCAGFLLGMCAMYIAMHLYRWK